MAAGSEAGAGRLTTIGTSAALELGVVAWSIAVDLENTAGDTPGDRVIWMPLGRSRVWTQGG